MHELYIAQCTEESIEPMKEKYYYKVFSTKFNLHFKQSSKDTRKTCGYLQIKTEFSDSEEMRMAKIEKDAHLQNAEQARSHMTADLVAASEDVFVFSFAFG